MAGTGAAGWGLHFRSTLSEPRGRELQGVGLGQGQG